MRQGQGAAMVILNRSMLVTTLQDHEVPAVSAIGPKRRGQRGLVRLSPDPASVECASRSCERPHPPSLSGSNLNDNATVQGCPMQRRKRLAWLRVIARMSCG